MLKRLKLKATLTFVACVFSLATSALADTAKHLEVPAGELVAALQALAKQAEIELVYQATELQGIRTDGLNGTYAPKEAVSLLIKGTKLILRTDEATGVMLITRPKATAGTILLPEGASSASDSGMGVQPRSSKERGQSEGRMRLAQGEHSPPGTGESQGEEGKSKSAPVFSEKEALSEVIVIGTRIGPVNEGVIPRTENGAVHYIVLDRGDIERSGATDIANLMQRVVPQNTNYGTALQANAVNINATGGFGGPNAETLNLRGFGNNQSVVLVNGRRLYGGEGRAGDVNRVPLSAIERIEILPSSGSALYGGNAVAGVVNIVLRRDFTGTEISARFSVAPDGSAPQGTFSISSGYSFGHGRTQLTWSADHTRSEPLTMGDRDFAARALQHIPFGSPLQIASGTPAFNFITLPFFAQTPATVFTASPLGLGIPGNPAATYAVVPAGSDGTNLTPASFSNTAGQANVGLQGRGTSGVLLPGVERYGFNAVLEHAVREEALGFYTEIGIGYEPQHSTNFNYLVQSNLSATDARNPFRTNVTPGFIGRPITVFMYPADGLPVRRDGVQRVGRLVTGLKGETQWGGRRLNWALDGSWEGNRNRGEFNEYAFTRILAVNTGLYNPLRDVSVNPHSPDIFAQNYRHVNTEEKTEITSGHLRLNSDVWKLPAGWTRMSLMGEVRREDFFSLIHNQTVGTLLAAIFPPGAPPSITDTTRRARSAGVEAMIPIIGGDWTPGIYGLELDLAWRYERYSDFRGEGSGLAAMKFALTPDIALRASFAEAYNPPTQVQLLAPLITSFSSIGSITTDPRRGGENVGPFGLTRVTGGNPDLQAETSDAWNAGLVLTPRALSGLTITLDYFRLHKVNQVESSNLDGLFVANEDLFGSRITRATPTAADIALGWPGRITAIDARAINLSDVEAEGYDVKIDWHLNTTKYGRFDLGMQGTYATSFKTQVNPRAPVIETVDYVGLLANPPVSFKGNVSLYWSRGRLLTGVTGRYIDSYKTDSTSLTPANERLFLGDFDGAEIPSSTEWDLEVGYAISDAGGATAGWRNWLDGTRWSLRINNVFDAEPPYITDRNGFYSRFNDPRMRYFIFSVQKMF